MKYFLMIVSIGLLFLSCKKDHGHEPSEEEMIIGDWTTTKVLLVDGHDGTVLSTEDIEQCNGETGFVFKDDHRFSLDTYYMKDGQCELTESNVGTYTYNEDAREIVLAYDGGQHETYTVYRVTETEMWFNLGKIDTDDDNDLIYHIIGLNK